MNRYVVADLHGQLDLLNQIIEYIDEDDIVYALGDFGDRGNEPWVTLRSVLDDEQFVYLMGNHDLLLINAIEEYYNILATEGRCDIIRCTRNSRGAIPLLGINGGINTLQGWAAEPEPEREKYYRKLKQLPLEIRLAAQDVKHFIYLTHAGYSPHLYNANDVKDLLWDRQHFYDKSDEDSLLFHGHTPVEVLVRWLDDRQLPYDCSNGCCVYSGGSKICVDMGSYFTKQTVLVNIDTLESKIFSIKEDIDGAEKN